MDFGILKQMFTILSNLYQLSKLDPVYPPGAPFREFNKFINECSEFWILSILMNSSMKIEKLRGKSTSLKFYENAPPKGGGPQEREIWYMFRILMNLLMKFYDLKR